MGFMESTTRGILTVAHTRIYWLHALTPLHVGTGQGTGFIDLPIMREKITQWPIVPGSSVKGVLADCYEATPENRRDNKMLRAAFGSSDNTPDDKDNAGSLVFTDARILCLAVRSLFGTFAWVTSPLVLQRFSRDLAAAGITVLPQHCPIQGENIHLPEGTTSALMENSKVYLEDLDFQMTHCNCAKQWAEKLARWIFPDDTEWQDIFTKRFAILPDSSFDYLCEMGTEVNARIRINPERKIVDDGALWYEESLPAETILAGLVWCDKVFAVKPAVQDPPITSENLLDEYCSNSKYADKRAGLQIGGKASVGKGRVRCVFFDKKGS